jgi:acyl transferase domain-containing protein
VDVEVSLAQFAAAGIRAKELTVSHAFHSPLMEPMLDAFERAAGRVAFGAPRLRMISNLTGRVATAAEIAQPGYWRRHVREPVQFQASMQTLASLGCTVFVELGPDRVLLNLARGCVAPEHALWLGSLRAGRDDWAEMLGSLSELYVHGLDVDWAGFERDYPRRKLSLPTYPFQRARYWLGRNAQRPPSAEAPRLHPLAERRVESPALKDVVFETRLSAAAQPFLGDHRVFGTIIFPAAGYLEAVRAAADLGLDGRAKQIEDLVIGEALSPWTKARKDACRSCSQGWTGASRASRSLAPQRPRLPGGFTPRGACAAQPMRMTAGALTSRPSGRMRRK